MIHHKDLMLQAFLTKHCSLENADKLIPDLPSPGPDMSDLIDTAQLSWQLSRQHFVRESFRLSSLSSSFVDASHFDFSNFTLGLAQVQSCR